MSVEMKVCEDCGRELPLTDFPKNGTDKNGYPRHRPDCKVCYGLKRAKGTRKRLNKFLHNDKTRTGVEPELDLMDWATSLAYFDGTCMYCGTKAPIKHQLTKDHIVPISKGGHTEKTNIGPCCRFCNTSKNNQDMETWYRKQKFFDEDRLKKIKEWMSGKVENINLQLFDQKRRNKKK